MHEHSLMADLFRKIESISRANGGKRIVGVKVKLGALSHISPEHFREHFVHSSAATRAENARLEIEILTDPADPHAHEIHLDSLEIEA